MQGRGMLKKPPRVRDNNGALQVRLRLDGRDHFINRLGRFDDPVAQARGQAICAEIWRDAQQGDLDLSLNRYRPLVEGRDQDLLDALRSLAEEKKQARVTYTFRVLKGFGCRSRQNQRLINDALKKLPVSQTREQFIEDAVYRYVDDFKRSPCQFG